jgi:hypothetical protein
MCAFESLSGKNRRRHAEDQTEKSEQHNLSHFPHRAFPLEVFFSAAICLKIAARIEIRHHITSFPLKALSKRMILFD